jgi:hypothetical protein
MYDYEGTSITAHRSDEEPWRLDRLHLALGFIVAKGVPQARIVALYECKGNLKVEWVGEPTDYDKSIVGNAWAWLNELPECIEHHVVPMEGEIK